jgi:hypothetical protein
MRCVSCGTVIDGDPAWATFADPGLRHKDHSANRFALHEECFERDRQVTVREAHQVATDELGGAVYEHRERTFTRYRKARAPKGAAANE